MANTRRAAAAADTASADKATAENASPEKAATGEEAARVATEPATEPVLFEPSPKRIKRTSPRKQSTNKNETTPPKLPAVTPSPKTNILKTRRSDSPWLAFDNLLQGGNANVNQKFPYKYPRYGIESTDKEWSSKYTSFQNSNDYRERKFHDAMEELLEDPLFAKPFGVENEDSTWEWGHIHAGLRWSHFAYVLSSYPKKRVRAVREEYRKDMALHSELLRELTGEIEERRQGGKRYYLRALNCILFDSFERCCVPLPPLPYWDLKLDMDIRRKDLYKNQLRAWNGYKSRVFAVVMLVLDNPMKRKHRDLPPIIPVKHRGEMVPMKEFCTNEEDVIQPKYEYRDDDSSDEDEDSEEDEGCESDLDEPQCECHECSKYYT